MANYILSAFADEYDPSIDKQIEGLLANDVHFIEIRGVDGTNISDITLEKAAEVRAKFDKNGIKLSSIGSPIGKIKLADDFEAHLEKLRHTCKVAKILGASQIRMFSFYMEEDADLDECRAEVMEKLGRMLEIAREEGIVLCHENEKGIYGATVDRCLDIQKEFGGEIRLIFDPANFIECGEETYPYGFNTLKEYIHYFHIKDAFGKGNIVPAGEGLGHIPEMMKEFGEYTDKDVFLTVEPHLAVFKGLDKLENKEGETIKKQYASSSEAFGVACSAIKKLI